GLLYAGIGSLRFRRWLPSANAHARAHLGLLLALLALTLTWGAVLDPAQSVAGLHGDLAGGALDARLTAAPVVAALGAAATTASGSGRAPGPPPPACRRTPWRAGAPPGSWRPLPISMPSPVRNPRRTGPRCTAVPGAGRGAPSRPSRTTRSFASRRFRRATPSAGSDRHFASSRSPHPTRGPRCAAPESRSRTGGAVPPSLGCCRAPRWCAARLTG